MEVKPKAFGLAPLQLGEFFYAIVAECEEGSWSVFPALQLSQLAVKARRAGNISLGSRREPWIYDNLMALTDGPPTWLWARWLILTRFWQRIVTKEE